MEVNEDEENDVWWRWKYLLKCMWPPIRHEMKYYCNHAVPNVKITKWRNRDCPDSDRDRHLPRKTHPKGLARRRAKRAREKERARQREIEREREMEMERERERERESERERENERERESERDTDRLGAQGSGQPQNLDQRNYCNCNQWSEQQTEDDAAENIEYRRKIIEWKLQRLNEQQMQFSRIIGRKKQDLTNQLAQILSKSKTSPTYMPRTSFRSNDCPPTVALKRPMLVNFGPNRRLMYQTPPVVVNSKCRCSGCVVYYQNAEQQHTYFTPQTVADQQLRQNRWVGEDSRYVSAVADNRDGY